ncbi:hypothetical protein QJS66_14125 [Kocuria rhizophila]|nr:hypothetical protein QJS66_14125 [Kocuria rhizophila]
MLIAVRVVHGLATRREHRRDGSRSAACQLPPRRGRRICALGAGAGDGDGSRPGAVPGGRPGLHVAAGPPWPPRCSAWCWASSCASRWHARRRSGTLGVLLATWRTVSRAPRLLMLVVVYLLAAVACQRLRRGARCHRGCRPVFVAYAVAMLIMRLVLGGSGPARDDVVVCLGLICFAVALGILAVACRTGRSSWPGAVTGLGYGTLVPAAQAIAVARCRHKLGTGVSTLLLLKWTSRRWAGQLVVLGLLLSATGFGTVHGAGRAGGRGGCCLYHAVHGRHPQSGGRLAVD